MFSKLNRLSAFSILIAIPLLSAIPARADWDFGAKYGGEFMTLGADSRSSAMGETGAALSSRTATPYWNPAALTSIKGGALTLMHADRFAGVVKYDFLSAAHRLSPTEAVSLTFYRLGVDDIPITALMDPTSPLSPSNPVVVSRWTTDSEMVISAAYALNRTPKLSLGAAAKIISKKVGYNQAMGLGFDAGALYQANKTTAFGARIADITTTYLGWDTGHNEIILPTISAGLIKTIILPKLDAELTLAADILFRTENRGDVDQFSAGPLSGETRFGLEYTVLKTLSLRTGFDSENFTAGAGINISALNIDYAYQTHSDLGESHRVSIAYAWKKNLLEKFKL